MRKLTEELANLEWSKFQTYMEECGLAPYYDLEKLKDELCTSPCGNTEEMGTAYKGALLVHINMTIGLAVRISKMISGTFPIDQLSLIKICCIMHLSKRFMYIENENEWERNNRGWLFKFNNDLPGCLKTGERSVLEALNNGVKLNEIEYEAIHALDEDMEAKQKTFLSIYTIITRQANELAYNIERERYKNLNK